MTEVWNAFLPICFLQPLDEARSLVSALFDVCKATNMGGIEVTEVPASGACREEQEWCRNPSLSVLLGGERSYSCHLFYFLPWMMTGLLLPVRLLCQHCKCLPLPIQTPLSQLLLLSLLLINLTLSSYISLGQSVLQLQTLLPGSAWVSSAFHSLSPFFLHSCFVLSFSVFFVPYFTAAKHRILFFLHPQFLIEMLPLLLIAPWSLNHRIVE